MIARSKHIGFIALMVASALHIGGFYVAYPQPEIQIAAAGAPAEVKQGSAFADMAAGVMTARAVTETMSPAQATDQAEAPPADSVEEVQPTQPTPAQPVEPMPTSQQRPDTQQQTDTPQRNETQTVDPSAAQLSRQVSNVQAVVPVLPTTPVRSVSPTSAQSVTTVTSITSVSATAVASVHPTTTVTGSAVNPSIVVSSPRPNVRPAGLAPPPPPRRAAVQEAPKPQQTSRGNANRNNSAGNQQSTSRTATATSSGSNAQALTSAAVANSQAASNYPGEVMRRISRIRKPRTNVRGTAAVRFSIAGSGGLASLAVARSSGNAQLDQMALRVIQSAAPFPTPPAGARTSFMIEIAGR